MEIVLQTAISNCVLSAALACVTFVFATFCNRTHVTRILWIIVLLKLVTPPIWLIPLPATSAEQPATGQSLAADNIALDRTATVQHEFDRDDVAKSNRKVPTQELLPSGQGFSGLMHSPRRTDGSAFAWQQYFVQVWFVTSGLCSVVLLLRIRRFQRMVRRCLLADQQLRQQVEETAKVVGLTYVPETRLHEFPVSPMVSPFSWKPILLLPRSLIGELNRDQLITVIAHELVHLKQRDHLVRFVEVIVTCLYWWNPVAWLARRGLHLAEEACCDAVVVCLLPDRRKSYGEALLRAAEFIKVNPSPFALTIGMSNHSPLKRRITVILNQQFSPVCSWHERLILLAVFAVILPPAAAQDQQPLSVAQAIESESVPTIESPVTIELAGTNDDVVLRLSLNTLEKRDATLLAIFRKLVTSSRLDREAGIVVECVENNHIQLRGNRREMEAIVEQLDPLLREQDVQSQSDKRARNTIRVTIDGNPNVLNKLKPGMTADVQIHAFPERSFAAQVDDVTDMSIVHEEYSNNLSASRVSVILTADEIEIGSWPLPNDMTADVQVHALPELKFLARTSAISQIAVVYKLSSPDGSSEVLAPEAIIETIQALIGPVAARIHNDTEPQAVTVWATSENHAAIRQLIKAMTSRDSVIRPF